MEHKKFRFKSGLTKQKEEPVVALPPPPAQPDVATLLSQLIDQKLAALVKPQAQPVQPPTDKDFAMIEESLVEAPVPVKAEVKEKPKLEAKKLLIEDAERRAEFEQLITEFNKNRSIQNEAKKKVDDARGTILETMEGNLIYDGDTLAVNIKEIANQSVNASAVVEALVDLKSESIEEIKAGVQQIIDLARLGIMEFGKTSFERWVKGHGYDPEPFITQHEKEKRIYVTPK